VASLHKIAKCAYWVVTLKQIHGFCFHQAVCNQVHGLSISTFNKLAPTLVFPMPLKHNECVMFGKNVSYPIAVFCKDNNVDDWIVVELPLLHHHIIRKVQLPQMELSPSHELFISALSFGKDDHPKLDSFMEILSPLYTSVQSGLFEVSLRHTGVDTFDNIHIEIAGLFNQYMAADTITISHNVTDIDIGSWFFTVTTTAGSRHPIGSGSGTDSRYEQRGYPAFGYVEMVLDDQQIADSRLYPEYNLSLKNISSSSSFNPSYAVSGPSPSNPPAAVESGVTYDICVFVGPIIDGQKQIWRNQAEFMNASQFQFTWLLSENARKGGPIVEFAASTSNVKTGTNPDLRVNLRELNDSPEDGRLPAAEVWNGDENELFRYARASLLAAHFDIDAMKPQWCRRFYTVMRTALVENACNLVVYGNNRGFNGDAVIVDTAALLDIPTMCELNNLYIHPEIIPTAIVGPSQFAITHPSIVSALAAFANATIPIRNVKSDEKTGILYTKVSRERSGLPRVVSIPPSVDSTVFCPEPSTNSSGTDTTRSQFHLHSATCIASAPVPETAPAAAIESAAESATAAISQIPRPPALPPAFSSVATGAPNARPQRDPCIIVGFVSRLAPGTF
jgi:hypothetical protein